MRETRRLKLDRIASSTRNARLTPEVFVGAEVVAEDGYILAVRIQGDNSSYNTVEDPSGRMIPLRAGDVLAGTLGSRRALKGYAGVVPETIEPGDAIDFGEVQKGKSRTVPLTLLNFAGTLQSKLLQKVMGEATRLLNAERSTLFLNDEKTNELWSEVGQGLESVQIRLPNHLGIAGAVFTSSKAINIPYAYADLRFNPGFDKKTGFFTRSILCVPVVNQHGKVIGVTQVLNKKSGPFTAED